MRAAVSHGEPTLTLRHDITIDGPRPNEVMVKVTHCGICHSDLSLHDLTSAEADPVVLGHEAAGVVEAVGESVSSVVPGDGVLLTAIGSCGQCYWCVRDQPSLCAGCDSLTSGGRADGTSPLSLGGASVKRGLGVGGFAEFTVVNARSVVRLDPDIPPDVACVIGCAIQTGTGAVFNVARVEPGATVLIAGLGGVGIAAVQGARIAGAASILVSDPVAERRDAATHFGATAAIDPRGEDITAWTRAQTGGIGVDYAFETAGIASLVGDCVQATRLGGTTIVLGADTSFATVELLPLQLATEGKRILGSLLGDCHPQRDIPRFVALWQAGVLDLEAMISHHLDLADINEGFEHLRAAKGIRTVVSVGT